MYKLAALYEYSRRRFESGVGDPYYADPGLVAAFLAAGEHLAARRLRADLARAHTDRCALAAAEAALLRSRASAQSPSLIAVRPAKVFGPASRWPPSIAMVSPVK